jgi:hypothetical protein
MPAFPYTFGLLATEPCADCGKPVPMEETDSGPSPLGGLFDGADVVHDRCYDARCPGNGLPLGCGLPLGVACAHRQRDGQPWPHREVA